MSHSGYARNFESVLRDLAAREHEVMVCTDRFKQVGARSSADPLEALLASEDRVSHVEAPTSSDADRVRLDTARGARLVLDYLRYLEPPFLETPKLTRRAQDRLTDPLARLVAPARGSLAYRRRLATLMRAVHTGAAPPQHYADLISRERPDVVLFTPLVELGSSQHEQLRAAKAAGVPTVLLVHSWDNLTTKGLVHIQPDLVAVWNGAQAAEAIELHGLDESKIAVTGAQAWDHWFDWRPSASRADFCAEVGLNADRPFVVYLGSSGFIAPDEATTVLQWLDDLRDARQPELAGLGVIARPHPTNPLTRDGLSQAQLKLRDDLVVSPREGENPTDEASRRRYFDTLHHAAAVVGVNTSAFLESAILGKPVYTVLFPQYRETQKGTVHFRHLLDDKAPLLHVATSGREHAQQLAEGLRHPAAAGARSHAFVESFVRPHGRETSATPLLSDAIEAAAGRRSLDVRRTRGERTLWAAARTAARLTESTTAGLTHLRRAAPASAISQRLPARMVARRSVTAASGADGAALREGIATAEELVDRIADTGRPVLFGPWTGEIGYELLYWIPMVRWAVERRPEIAERLHVVSRGGTADWYGELGHRYADVLSLVDHTRYLADRSPQKQRSLTDFERAVMKAAEQHFALDAKGAWVHPSAMFKAYFRFVKSRRESYVEAVRPTAGGAGGLLSSYRPIDVARILRPAGLPDRYVAARFYHRESFPPDLDSDRWVRQTLDALRSQAEVVLLDAGGVAMDEHRDIVADAAVGNAAPATNLERQTAIVAHADAFVGTYGGLSYLAPHLGRRSLAFSSVSAGLQAWHEQLASALFDGPGWGRLEHMMTRDIAPSAVAAYITDSLAQAR